MDYQSTQQQQQPQLQPPSQQTYDPTSSSSSQMQAYQFDQNSSNQQYYPSDPYYHSYYQHYYHQQQQQQQQQPQRQPHHDQQSYPYQAHVDYSNSYTYNYSYYDNNPNKQHQLEENSIYPPGVEPPLAAAAATHNFPRENVIVKGPVGVVGASSDHFNARAMQHHLPMHHPKFPQGATYVPRPSHVSMSGSAHKAFKPQKHSAKVKPPRPLAWCELCRVDCNSLEILEQHKNGKKHKKNLKVHEELQDLNKVLKQNEKNSAPESKPGIRNHAVSIEGSSSNPLMQVNPASQSVSSEKEVENTGQNTGDAEHKEEESGTITKKNSSEARGSGSKRKMKGGKGVKWMKSSDGSRRPVEPQKPKEVIPFICELCNVKCESLVVFQSHLSGKKHLTNLKRFQGEQTMIGQAALQALYPALQALVPALQELCQGDLSSLISQLQQQGMLGLQGFIGQPGPSMLPQGQASGTSPATISALPHPSVSSEQQQDVPLEGSKAADDGQSSSLTESKGNEQSVAADCSKSDPVAPDCSKPDPVPPDCSKPDTVPPNCSKPDPIAPDCLQEGVPANGSQTDPGLGGNAEQLKSNTSVDSSLSVACSSEAKSLAELF